jgi:hypothetical protein
MKRNQWKQSAIYFVALPDPIPPAARDTNLPDFDYVVSDMDLIHFAGDLNTFEHSQSNPGRIE